MYQDKDEIKEFQEKMTNKYEDMNRYIDVKFFIEYNETPAYMYRITYYLKSHNPIKKDL